MGSKQSAKFGDRVFRYSVCVFVRTIILPVCYGCETWLLTLRGGRWAEGV